MFISDCYLLKELNLRARGCAFLRGGNWNNGANAGAFTLNLNNAPTNTNNNIGFRCARYSLTKKYGLNEISKEISLRHKDYGFNSRPAAILWWGTNTKKPNLY